MENTFAFWGFTTAGCIALVLVYAIIADKWYKLRNRVQELSDELHRNELWHEKQRAVINDQQQEIGKLRSMLRVAEAKQPAKKYADAKRDRSKGFTANNDIKVWHKCVPSKALARVQARINKGDQWANIYASTSGWVVKIVEANRQYRSQAFADRNRAKQFRDVMLSSYFAANPGKMGAKQ